MKDYLEMSKKVIKLNVTIKIILAKSKNSYKIKYLFETLKKYHESFYILSFILLNQLVL